MCRRRVGHPPFGPAAELATCGQTPIGSASYVRSLAHAGATPVVDNPGERPVRVHSAVPMPHGDALPRPAAEQQLRRPAPDASCEAPWKPHPTERVSPCSHRPAARTGTLLPGRTAAKQAAKVGTGRDAVKHRVPPHQTRRETAHLRKAGPALFRPCRPRPTPGPPHASPPGPVRGPAIDHLPIQRAGRPIARGVTVAPALSQ
jgi:hypothetical protein